MRRQHPLEEAVELAGADARPESAVHTSRTVLRDAATPRPVLAEMGTTGAQGTKLSLSRVFSSSPLRACCVEEIGLVDAR